MEQHSKITHLGCILDETMSGKLIAVKVINEINTRLKFLHRSNYFLAPVLRRLLCYALIQLHFDYASLTWYLNPKNEKQNSNYAE